jgi:cobalamin synthase
MMDAFDKQKLFDSYAAALSKAWESYIKIIDLLLGLAGATALVFVASIKITDWASFPNKGCIVYVFIFSAMAMIFGTCWRFASQHFMEYETLGSPYAASNYFDTSGIEPVTTAHQANSSIRSFYRFCFRVFPILMGIFLLSAWISIFLVFFSGMPTVV